MAKTCLQIASQFCARTALTQPTTIFTSNDDGFVQLAALMNEGIDDLTTRHVWGALQQECLHTTVAAEEQGDINTLAPNGFLEILRNEIWNRTSGLLLDGPVSASAWQALKASGIGGPLPQWRIRQDKLLLYPAPSAGQVLAFEYASNFSVITTGAPGTRQMYFTADTDLFLLPERLMYAWLRWRWKAEKGFKYDEEFRSYESLIAQAASKDNEGRQLDMSGEANTGPGIFVPSGTWVPSS
jgi:hypothetical protein